MVFPLQQVVYTSRTDLKIMFQRRGEPDELADREQDGLRLSGSPLLPRHLWHTPPPRPSFLGSLRLPEFTSLEFPSRRAPSVHPRFSRVTLG